MIETIGIAAKTYLAAIGAAAIYVSVDQGNVIGVGVARDLDKATRRMRRIISPAASFGWIAWAANYDALLSIAQTPNLLCANRDNGIKVALPLDELVATIEMLARARGLTLTPHARAVERAELYANYVDQALEAMQRDGTFASFNRAYKAHRQERSRQNESVTPYWAVMLELRTMIIRGLVNEPQRAMVPATVKREMQKEFPWFSRLYDRNHAKPRRRRR